MRSVLAIQSDVMVGLFVPTISGIIDDQPDSLLPLKQLPRFRKLPHTECISDIYWHLFSWAHYEIVKKYSKHHTR